MGAQSRSLQQHWRRGITMGDTVRLLSDINSIVDTPQRLQKLEEAKASLSPTCLLASRPENRNTGFQIPEGLQIRNTPPATVSKIRLSITFAI